MQSEVLIRVERHLGHVTLTRPDKLNALSWSMIRSMTRALLEWERDDQITAVLIDSDSRSAFCAGGDIESTYTWIRGTPSSLGAYWRDEHKLVFLIASFTKPIVTLLDGYVLGGGVGIGCHASHRLVTPTAKLGMPEVTIGLAPDVGGLYLLATAPDNMGIYLALTGNYANAPDAIRCGLADRLISYDGRLQLQEALRSGEHADLVVQTCDSPSTNSDVPTSELADHLTLIRDCFNQDSLDSVLERLRRNGTALAVHILDRLSRMAPTALRVTFDGLRRVRQGASLEDTLLLDVRRNVHFSEAHDLSEGIRAAVIDKDKRPTWDPPTLDLVTDDDVNAYLLPLGSGDLSLADVAKRPVAR